MSHFIIPYGLGWHPDLPDPRDLTPQHREVAAALATLQPTGRLPKCVQWQEYCAEVEDRGDLPTSAAHACVALVRYFEQRRHGKDLRAVENVRVPGGAATAQSPRGQR